MKKGQASSLGREAANRILALQKLGETDAELARRLGLSSQQISNYRNGGKGASLEVVRDVAVRTGVPVDHFLGVETDVSKTAAEMAQAQAKLDRIRRIIDGTEDASLSTGAGTESLPHLSVEDAELGERAPGRGAPKKARAAKRKRA